jgi:hypothetical protein
VVGGAVAGSVGESVVSETVSHWAGFIETRLRKLHESFTRRRVEWIAGLLQDHLLGRLPTDLQMAATIDQSPAFQRVKDLAAILGRVLTEPEA